MALGCAFLTPCKMHTPAPNVWRKNPRGRSRYWKFASPPVSHFGLSFRYVVTGAVMSNGKREAFNLDGLAAVLQKTVRRSLVMIGVGLNATEMRPLISHVLAPDGPFHLSLVPESIDEASQLHIMDEFGKWVRANGLRELLEGFSVFLHQVYWVWFLIARTANVLPEKPMPPVVFEKRGIAFQIEKLAEVVVVDKRSQDVVASLNQARNCYAHRQGRVGPPDLQNDELIITWNRITLSVKEQDGNVVDEAEMFERVFEHESTIQMQVVQEWRRFTLGEEIVLSKRDLKEICLHVQAIGEQLLSELISLGKETGTLKIVSQQDTVR